jgi:hypothetical protein
MIASRSPVAGFRRELEAAPRPNKVPTNHAGQWVMVRCGAWQTGRSTPAGGTNPRPRSVELGVVLVMRRSSVRFRQAAPVKLYGPAPRPLPDLRRRGLPSPLSSASCWPAHQWLTSASPVRRFRPRGVSPTASEAFSCADAGIRWSSASNGLGLGARSPPGPARWRRRPRWHR